MTTALPLGYGDVVRNNWEIVGQFMYPAGTYRSCLAWYERDCSISVQSARCGFRLRHYRGQWMQRLMQQTLNVSLLSRNDSRHNVACTQDLVAIFVPYKRAEACR
jgi:hypothetical protein